MMKKTVALGLISILVGCGLKPIKNEYEVPQAIGRLIVTHQDDTRSQCYATLIEDNRILTNKHCYVGPGIMRADFYAPGDTEPYLVYKPGHKLENISSLKDFPKDTAIMRLITPANTIKPLKIAKKKLDNNFLSYAQGTYPDKGIDHWKECYFSKKDYIENAQTSTDCQLPKGNSGLPFLEWQDGEWKIVGIYHGFINVKNRNDGKPTIEGVATMSENW